MPSTRIMLLCWGRRGAMPRFTLDLARVAAAEPGLQTTVSISRQNELFDQYLELGPRLMAVDTFAAGSGAILKAWRIPALRSELARRIRLDRIDAVIELMPHVWSRAVMPAIAKAGARYATIIHDAAAHPGDLTGLVNGLMNRTAEVADRVLTLSPPVTRQLAAGGVVREDRIRTLFHPDLAYATVGRAMPSAREPLRLLFLGRIMPYKGLSLFVDALEQLKSAGYAVEAGVFGEGALGADADRLVRLGAEVVNRWLTDEEIAGALSRYHVMVLSHTEASQSGVAAAAMGAGLPVVATPVGGLVDQVKDGETGLIAESIDAAGLVKALKRLLDDRDLYPRLAANVASGREARSMRAFLKAAVTAALD